MIERQPRGIRLYDGGLVALVLVCGALAVGTPDCGWPNGRAVEHVYKGAVANDPLSCHIQGGNFHPTLGVGQVAVVQCVDASNPQLVNVK